MKIKYILNPNYILRHDTKRTYIVARQIGIKTFGHSEKWVGMIHPVQAMILSFFSVPETLSSAFIKVADFLEKDEKEISDMLTPYIENEEQFFTEYDGGKFYFPKNVIVKHDKSFERKTGYEPTDFIFEELDFNIPRYIRSPLNMTLMLNNKCATDCIYCYADKSKPIDCEIPFDKMEDIVRQAFNLGMMEISLLGGEVFNYKDWYKLGKLLADHDFHINFLSTKIPLKEDDVLKLKEFKKLKMQLSLDSIEETELSVILNTNKNYVEGIKNTINLFEKHKIKYQVATVCTRINGNRGSIKKMFDFLKTKKYLSRWDIRIAFRSLYSKSSFEKYKLSLQESKDLMSYVSELNDLGDIKISKDEIFLNKKTHEANEGTKSFYGARCSSNFSHIFILPDGNVTFCEQLYWKERFFVGNILKQTIEEIWNSPASLKWSHLERNDFSDKSPCKACDLFEECYHNYTNKCMPDVIKAYGEENWDFPDPRCVKAPKLINSIY